MAKDIDTFYVVTYSGKEAEVVLKDTKRDAVDALTGAEKIFTYRFQKESSNKNLGRVNKIEVILIKSRQEEYQMIVHRYMERQSRNEYGREYTHEIMTIIKPNKQKLLQKYNKWKRKRFAHG